MVRMCMKDFRGRGIKGEERTLKHGRGGAAVGCKSSGKAD